MTESYEVPIRKYIQKEKLLLKPIFLIIYAIYLYGILPYVLWEYWDIFGSQLLKPDVSFTDKLLIVGIYIIFLFCIAYLTYFLIVKYRNKNLELHLYPDKLFFYQGKKSFDISFDKINSIKLLSDNALKYSKLNLESHNSSRIGAFKPRQYNLFGPEKFLNAYQLIEISYKDSGGERQYLIHLPEIENFHEILNQIVAEGKSKQGGEK